MANALSYSLNEPSPLKPMPNATAPAPAPMAKPTANALAAPSPGLSPYAMPKKPQQNALLGMAVDGFMRGFAPQQWQQNQDQRKADGAEKAKQTLALMQQQRAIPTEQRGQWWQQNAPTISEIIGQDVSQMPVDVSKFSDQALDGQIAALSAQLGIAPDPKLMAERQQRQQMEAMADQIGLQGRERLAFMSDPEAYAKAISSNYEAANVGGGDSRLVNGKFVTAPKLGVDGGYGYTQGPDGVVWGDQRGQSYAEVTDAATQAETGRHNRVTERIDQGQLDLDRKKAETDAALAEIPDFGDENSLRNQYLGQAKTFQEVRNAHSRIQSVGNAKNPAEQMALIFGYMKMLDPGSTVREGEYATAQNTTGIPGWVTNAYNKAKDGVFLNEQQVKDFLRQAGDQYRSAETIYGQTLDTYRDYAKRYRMDPSIIQDMRLPGAAPTPAERRSRAEMYNPLGGGSLPAPGQRPPASQPMVDQPPAGIDPEDWKFMDDSQKALFR